MEGLECVEEETIQIKSSIHLCRQVVIGRGECIVGDPNNGLFMRSNYPCIEHGVDISANSKIQRLSLFQKISALWKNLKK